MKNGITINELDDTLISKINKSSGDTDGDISKLELSADKIKLDNKKYKAKNVDTALTEVSVQYEEITQDMMNLKTHVDDGKNNLYSAIVGKKVTPRGKDFVDLTKAVKDIKLGQGNATENDVLEGKTFTNSTGIEQAGTMKNRGSLVVGTTVNDKDYGQGYFANVKSKGLENESDEYVQKIIKDVINNNEKINNVLAEKIIKDITTINPDLSGKKFAQGKAMLTNPYTLNVSNLNFKPSIVLIDTSRGTSYVTYRCIESPIISISPFSFDFNKRYEKTNGDCTINEDGFNCTELFNKKYDYNIPCDWIAIE